MTLPNGLNGISEAIGTLFASGGPLTPVPGAATWGSLGISEMNTLTQDIVTGLLGENMIKNSPNWNAMSSLIYQGLTPGIPWSLAIIEQFVSAITGLPLGSWGTVNEALLALEGIASNVDLEANWTTLLTDLGVTNAAELAGYISDLQGDVTAGQTASATLWTSWGTALTEIVGGDWTGGLADAETAWQTYQTAITGITSAEYVTISQFLASIGIHLPTGQMNATNVTSGTGLTSLADDWNKVVSFWDNLFGVSNDPTTTQVQSASVSSGTGLTSLTDDWDKVVSFWDNLFGISNDPTVDQVQAASVSHVVGGSSLGDDLATLVGNVANILGSGTSSGTTAQAAAAQSLTVTSNTLTSLAAAAQAQATQQTGQAQSGRDYRVNFSSYPDGPFSEAPFTIAKTGAGTGGLAISGGKAVWNAVNNGDVSALGIYTPGYTLTFTGSPTGGTFTITYVNPITGVSATTTAIAYNATAATIQAALQALTNMPASSVVVIDNPSGGFIIDLARTGRVSVTSSITGGTAVIANTGVTDTDYQEFRATLAGLPNGAGSKNFGILRASPDGTSYVYGVVYLSTSYQLDWEIGCYVSGTQHVFATGVNAPLNLSFTMLAGVGTEPYRFQGISGNTVVFDYTDSAHVSRLGSGFRSWGFRSDTYSSGQVTPAPASYCGCADNQPPAVIGSGFRRYRSSATPTSMAMTTGSPLLFGSTFFDTTLERTPDYSFPATGYGVYGPYGAVVANPGWYDVEFRSDMQMATSASMETLSMGVLRVNSAGTVVETKLLPGGPGLAFNVVGAQSYTSHFSGAGGIYCNAGDLVVPFYYIDGPGAMASLSFLGSADGAHTYWGMRLANWSLS